MTTAPTTPGLPAAPGATPKVSLDSLIQRPTAGADDPKVSVLALGFEKSGKSTMLLSLPAPQLVIQTDPNRGALDAALAAGRDIQLIPLEPDDPGAWRTFHDTVLPAIHNRELDVASIIVDSFGYLFQLMQLATPKGSDGFEYWRKVKERGDDMMRRLCRTTSPFPQDPTRRRYNVGVACHLQEITNEAGGVVGFRPGLQGAFKNEIGRIPSTVLYLESKEETVVTPGQAGSTRVAKHLAHTVSPNSYVSCGDSIGSPAGRWRPLPPTIEDPSYAKLAECWGFPGTQSPAPAPAAKPPSANAPNAPAPTPAK